VKAGMGRREAQGRRLRLVGGVRLEVGGNCRKFRSQEPEALRASGGISRLRWGRAGFALFVDFQRDDRRHGIKVVVVMKQV